MNNDKSAFEGIINSKVGSKLAAKAIDLNDGTGQGVLLRLGSFVVTVSESRAIRFADRIIDAVEAGARTAESADQRRDAEPTYARHSAALEAADGTPEQPLPATSAE